MFRQLFHYGRPYILVTRHFSNSKNGKKYRSKKKNSEKLTYIWLFPRLIVFWLRRKYSRSEKLK